MTQRRFALVAHPAIRTGAVFSAIAVAGFGVASADIEEVVAHRFTAALEAVHPQPSVLAGNSRSLVSGSEAFWLAQKHRRDGDGPIQPAAWSAPLAAGLSVGDHITISRGKSERVLEVVAIADVEPAAGTAVDAQGAKQVAITCRDTGTPEGRLTTFLAPAETAAPTVAKTAL
jgi:hypothetical protein